MLGYRGKNPAMERHINVMSEKQVVRESQSESSHSLPPCPKIAIQWQRIAVEKRRIIRILMAVLLFKAL